MVHGGFEGVCTAIMTLHRGLVVHFCPRPWEWSEVYAGDDIPEECPAIVCDFGKGFDGQQPWATLQIIGTDSGQFTREVAVPYSPVAVPRTWHFASQCEESAIEISMKGGAEVTVQSKGPLAAAPPPTSESSL